MTVWDFASGKSIRKLKGHRGGIEDIAITQDGSRAVSASADMTLKVWDLLKGQLIHTLKGHTGIVNDVALTQDGHRIISGSDDGTIKVWDLKTGDVLVTLLAHKDGEWLAITPEGFFASSKNGTDMVNIVRGMDVMGIGQLYQALYRPDLIKEKLAGDPSGRVKKAASKLNLDKILASGTAPRVNIVPSDKSRAGSDSVKIKVDLSDTGGGIGRIEWRINGITLGVTERGLVPVRKRGGRDGCSFTGAGAGGQQDRGRRL